MREPIAFIWQGSFRLYGDGFTYNSSSFLADYLAKNCPEIEKVCRIFYDWNEKKKLRMRMLSLWYDV